MCMCGCGCNVQMQQRVHESSTQRLGLNIIDYLCQAMCTFVRQCVLVPGNVSLCQAICPCARQCVLVPGNVYFCQTICTCDKQFVLVPGNLYSSTHINLSYAQIDICPRVFLIFKQCRNREPDSLNQFEPELAYVLL